MSDEELANKWIKDMTDAAFTPDEMIAIFRLAREKYEQMRIKYELKINKFQNN